MKIHYSPLNSLPASTAPATRVDSAAAPGLPAGDSAKGQKNSVDLSSAALHLSKLQDTSNDINIEKVNELRAAIAAGQLKINPDRIADKLIASVRDLLK